MKKLKNIVIVTCCSLAGIFMTSCGGSSKSSNSATEKTVKVESSDIYGDDSEYCSIVPGDYSLKEDGSRGLAINLKLKLDKQYPVKISDVSGPSVVLKDSLGKNIFNYKKLSLAYNERDKMKTFLTKKKVGDEMIFLFDDNYIDEDDVKYALNNTASIEVNGFSIKPSDNEEVEQTSNENNDDEVSDNDEDSDDNSTVASGSIDELLNQYEKAIKKYEKDSKENDGGILGSVVNMSSAMDKLESLSKKIEKKENKMTSKQKNRYAELNVKMAALTMKSIF